MVTLTNRTEAEKRAAEIRRQTLSRAPSQLESLRLEWERRNHNEHEPPAIDNEKDEQPSGESSDDAKEESDDDSNISSDDKSSRDKKSDEKTHNENDSLIQERSALRKFKNKF
jgi:hypothetical protein